MAIEIKLSSFLQHDTKNSFYFEIHADLKNLESLINDLRIKLVFLEPISLIKTELVIAELINNIIIHNYKKNNELIILNIKTIGKRILITIYDNGSEWDSSKYIAKNDDFKFSGRGIQMVKDMSSHFSIKRLANINKTRVAIKI